MSMDITPIVPAGKQVIDGYGPGTFVVASQLHEGAILVLAEETIAWPVTDFAALTAESFAPLFGRGLSILLLGCGPRMRLVPSALRKALRAEGIVVDVMDTGAACRTFNILMAEERSVAAALLPI